MLFLNERHESALQRNHVRVSLSVVKTDQMYLMSPRRHEFNSLYHVSGKLREATGKSVCHCLLSASKMACCCLQHMPLVILKTHVVLRAI
jgi:hypothetical protein